MKPLRVSCTGFALGRLRIPPFQVHTGESVCLHVPPACGAEKDELAGLLARGRDTASLRFDGRVAWAQRPLPRRGFLGRWRNPSTRDWLTHSAGLSPDQAAAVLDRLQLPGDCKIGYLSGDPKLWVALEAALTRGADIVIFDTVGASPGAIRKAYGLLAAHLDRHALLNLSYCSEKSRICPPAARCIALQTEDNSCIEAQTAPSPSTPS